MTIHTSPFSALLLVCAVLAVSCAVWMSLPQKEAPVLLSEVKESYISCIEKEDSKATATCLDALASSIYGVYPTSAIALELDSVSEAYKGEWCHEVMHFMGWQAFKVEGDIAKAFLNSSEFCDSGMYHGVMEEFLRREGLSDRIEDIVHSVCADSLASHPDMSDGVLSLCNHGLGHGLMYITSSDLKRSLELCDALDEGDAGTCYIGALMEFNTSKDIGPLVNHRDLSDFSYCLDLNERHKDMCFFRQGLNNFAIAKTDVKTAMEFCLQVPQEYITRCFEGVGSSNPGPGKKHSDAARSCKGALEITEEAYKGCIDGSLSFVLQLEWGDMDKAREFCEVIEEPYKHYCYTSAGNSAVAWMTDGETKEEKCASFPTDDAQSACLQGMSSN